MADEFDQYADDEFAEFAEPDGAPAEEAPGILETIGRTGMDALSFGMADKVPGNQGMRIKDGKIEDVVPLEEQIAANRERTAAGEAANPGTALATKGAAFFASGGAKLLQSVPAAARAAPGAIKALGSAEGLVTAGKSALKAAPSGVIPGAAAGAGQAEPGEEAEGAVKGAGWGVLLSGLLGGLGGAGSHGLETKADDLAGQVGRAETVEQYDAALKDLPGKVAAQRAEYVRALRENSANVGQMKTAYEAAKAEHKQLVDTKLGEHAQKVAAQRTEYANALKEHRADVAQQKAAYEAAKAEHEQVAQGLQADYDRAVTEAETAARTPSRDAALRFAGLEGKQRKLGGPGPAKKAAEDVYDYRLPSGGRITETLADMEPEAAQKLVKGLKDQVGAELGAIRKKLAANPQARVRAEDIQQEVHQAFASWPSEARAKALEFVDGKIAEQMRDGYLPAAAVRALVDDMTEAAKFGSPNLQAALGDRAKDVYRAARRALSGSEKKMVGDFLPDERGNYDRGLGQFKTFANAEEGQGVRFERANKGQPDIKYPKAQLPDQPEIPAAPERPSLPGRPARPEALAKPELPAGPVEPAYPAKPVKPEPIAGPAVPEGLDEMRAEMAPTLSASKKAAIGAAGTVGGALGAKIGSVAGPFGAVAGGALGGSVAATKAREWLTAVAPSASSLTADAIAASGRLDKWVPMFEKAATEGPRAIAVLHHVLLQSNPDYRSVFEGAPDQEMKVTAHEQTETSMPPVAAAEPAPKNDLPDIVSSLERDALVREHFKNNPQPTHSRHEKGWLVKQGLPGLEDGAYGLSEPIIGEEHSTEFKWTPSKDRVSAAVHTHPGTLGNRALTAKNAHPSPEDSEMVTRGHIPSYVYGTDGRIRVLERINGKIVERELEGPVSESD